MDSRKAQRVGDLCCRDPADKKAPLEGGNTG